MRQFKRVIQIGLGVALVASTLSACAPLVVAGAAGSVMVASDRRTAGTQLEDESIELRAKAAIRDQLGTRVRIDVTAYNRQALLTGEVGNAADKQAAERIVQMVQNVGRVENDLGIANTPSRRERAADLVITGRVKAAFIDKKVPITAVKVTTERSVVYLMGRVTAKELAQATEAASSVPGVQRVVRLFDTISQQELDRLQAAGK